MPVSKGLPEGKKRYIFTLTTDTVDRVHVYLKKNCIPKSVLSAMIDEFLTDSLRTWDELSRIQAKKGSTVELGEFLQVLGKVMTDKKGDQQSLL